MARRSLPVSVIPQQGEALESWLGTLATRLDVRYGELLVGVGSSINGCVDLRRTNLSVYLTDLEAAAVATSTGVSPALLMHGPRRVESPWTQRRWSTATRSSSAKSTSCS